MISFTGSTVVGKRIMEKGAATMKRLFLELGGKSATIVFEDADFNTACLIGIGPLMHAGQGCAVPTRMLLPRSRYDEGVAILKGIYENIKAGDPQDPGTICGPVISAKQQSRILGYIQKGVDEGATHARRQHRAAQGIRQGMLGQPNAFHRCRQLDDDRPGGDLRARARRHSLRGRRRRDPDRQRQRVRPGGQRDVELARPIRLPSRAGCAPDSSASTAPRDTARTRRSAVTRTAASDARTA